MRPKEAGQLELRRKVAAKAACVSRRGSVKRLEQAQRRVSEKCRAQAVLSRSRLRGRRELGVSMVTCQVTDNEVTWARGLSADARPSLQNLGIL